MSDNATMTAATGHNLDTARIRALAAEHAAGFPPLSREQATLVRAMIARRPTHDTTGRGNGRPR